MFSFLLLALFFECGFKFKFNWVEWEMQCGGVRIWWRVCVCVCVRVRGHSIYKLS